MKQLTNIQRAIQFLNKVFRLANAEYFNNELPQAVITIQSSPKAYGSFTPWKAWRIKDAKGEEHGQVEINIGAGTLDRPIENVVSTLIHEMVHYYCYLNNIKDVSRGGQYHNKRFKEEAEKRGLQIDYDPRIGFSITSPTEKLLDWIINNQLEDILIGRNEVTSFLIGGGAKAWNGGINPGNQTPKGNSHKLECPCCHTKIRYTTKQAPRIMCMDCNEQFIEA